MSNDQSRTQFESWYQQRFGHSLYLEWNDQGFYESPATGNLFAAFGARPAVQVSSDYAELQRLAEAAPEGPWFGPEYAPGTSYVFDVDLGSLLHYDSIESEQDACLRYVAAANPAVVMALLADLDEARNGMKFQPALRLKKEIERLDAEVGSLRKIISESAAACGAAVSVECSLEFMQHLPAEIASVVGGLRKRAPAAEVQWCACGDGHAVNSYGAGFMDANDGVCWNCDGANGGADPRSWCLMTDAQPNPGVQVLIFIPACAEQESALFEKADEFFKEEHFVYGDHQYLDAVYVSHWMPLPSDPEVGQ